jgi:VWFA-related protein
MARLLRYLAISSAVVVSCGLVTSVPVETQNAVDKTIFVSVLDEAGKPVKDLKTAEFRVREDGADREVVDAKLATEPLYVTLLVDTTPGTEPYIQDIRKALAAFAQQIAAGNPEARISVMEFGQAAVPLVPFTTDREKLDSTIKRIYPKRSAESVLLEALHDAANALAKQSSRRRAVVVFTMEPGRENTTIAPQKVQEAFQKSGAQLWVLSLRKQAGLTDNSQRDLVLNLVTKNTGGHREGIVAQSAIDTYLLKYADVLTSQYAVTYRRPASERPQVVQTGITRGGQLKMHASLFAPQ